MDVQSETMGGGVAGKVQNQRSTSRDMNPS